MTTWQDIAALLIVFAAALYLCRAVYQVLARRKAAGCGTCGSCPANAASRKPVVSSDSLQVIERK